MFEFHWPTKTIFASGLTDHINQYLIPPTEPRVLIVAPKEEWAQPLIQRIANQLREGGWDPVEIFSEVEPNPSWKTVASGVKRVKKMGTRAVLAIGGGSVIDAAKVIAERGEANFLCTMPTTAGTGSEISPWAVISNLQRREKESVAAMWPNLALLDPSLTVTMPSLTTLYTGIDAFVHGLEAYLSNTASPVTDALAYAGMRLASENLSLVMTNPEDDEGRGSMLEASLLTGAAMLHAGLGLIHAIGNVAGGLYHELPHGLILAQCMDVVLDYNRLTIAGKLAQIEDMIEQLRSEQEGWFERLHVERVSLSEKDIALLAKRAAVNINAKTNPRPAEVGDVQALVSRAFDVEA